MQVELELGIILSHLKEQYYSHARDKKRRVAILVSRYAGANLEIQPRLRAAACYCCTSRSFPGDI